VITTCKCGAPLVDSDDGICEKCFIHQVYEMDNPGPRWQTLAEALPKEGEVVCVEMPGLRRIAAQYSRYHVRPSWLLDSGHMVRAFANHRWHPWPGEGKK